MKITDLFNFDVFDPNILFKMYNDEYEEFNVDDFRHFISNVITDANNFENNIGIPKKYFINNINLSLLEKNYFGYSKVKDIFIYSDDDNNIIFLKNKKIISTVKYKNQNGNWLIPKLDKLMVDYENVNTKDDIDKNLYLSKKMDVVNTHSFFIRYYLDSLYDVVVKFKNKYFLFFDIKNINEYSFLSNHIKESELLKIKRMLKVNKLEINNMLTKINR